MTFIEESLERDEELHAGDGKVVRGKEGWLFLAHDSNAVLLQQSGQLPFTPQQLEDWRLLLETRTAWCEAAGAHYFFLIPPNSHSVYPEMLPAGVVSAPDRPVLQLLGHLAATELRRRVIYPTEELLEEKQRSLVYIKTDTHWNSLGAFVGCTALMKQIARFVPVRILERADLVLTEVMQSGDLGAKVTPPIESTHLHASPREIRGRLVSDNRVENNGAIIEYACPVAPATTCIVFGDSFAYRPLNFLPESFGRLVFAHHPRLDFELVREFRPDVVINILNERFIRRIPYDLPGATVREVALERIAQGRMRPLARRHREPDPDFANKSPSATP